MCKKSIKNSLWKKWKKTDNLRKGFFWLTLYIRRRVVGYHQKVDIYE